MSEGDSLLNAATFSDNTSTNSNKDHAKVYVVYDVLKISVLCYFAFYGGWGSL